MAGKMKNCPVCGKLFVATPNMRVCRDCIEKEQEQETEAVNYVRYHPKAKIPEIVEATGVSEALIKRLIREGRFEQVGIKLCYPCEKCGAPIVVGKLCSNCSEELQKELQQVNAKKIVSHVAPKPQSTTKGGIRSKSIL